MLNNMPYSVSFLLLFFPMLCFRYGFGEAGKPVFGIEPNAELVYEVTLKSFEKVRMEFLQITNHPVHIGCLLTGTFLQ